MPKKFGEFTPRIADHILHQIMRLNCIFKTCLKREKEGIKCQNEELSLKNS